LEYYIKNYTYNKYFNFFAFDISVPLHSFWTGGTRNGCIGQYAWCFGLNQTIWRLNVLANSASSAGSCVLISRMRNATGNIVYAPLTEVCTAKASLACVGDNKIPVAYKSGKSVFITKKPRAVVAIKFSKGKGGGLLHKSYLLQPKGVPEKCALI
jgi:hypothetical protein